ncbi:MAG: hypothetical protein TEF_05705 [Rhizobiales bacterium NRL2]|jgi:hypothetical protein|nr:MAG: hypothetical protein TEF_05705 [Rhizobiales bacterium NRL2]
MTVSRARAGLGLAAAAAILLAVAGAAAQNPPRSLVPDAAPSERPGPVRESDVRVDRLEAPGRASVGLLGPGESGLPEDLWNGADRATVAALLRRLPPYYRSATARDLARRLLLSTGRMPAGGISDAELLALRMEHLLTMGQAQSVVALAEAAGGGISEPEVAEILAEAQFALGEADSACDTVQATVRAGGSGYWQRASVFCDLRAGRRADAELMRSLIAESGNPDPIFRDLADAVADETPVTVEADPSMRALHLAMLQAAPSATLTRAGNLPPYLAAIVASGSGHDPATRIAAGERAVAHAGLAPSVVMLVYDMEGAADSPSPYREPVVSAMVTQEVAGRAEALNELWSRAAESGEHDLAAGYARGILERLEPGSAIAFLAPAAIRMSLLNGGYERAEAWTHILGRGASGGGSDLVQANTAFLPLAQVAGLTGTDTRKLRVWWSVTGDQPQGRTRALRVLMTLDALGQPADADLWADLLAEDMETVAGVDEPALWRQLVMASGTGSTGEALLAALALTGADSAGNLDPVTLSTIAGVLRRAGLQAEARQLAIEAVIAQGD